MNAPALASTVVIAGGGQGGFQAATSLRQGGFGGRVVIVSREDRVPYQRPPLSKAYLKEEQPFERLMLRPPEFYAANGIELRLGQSVERIDRAARTVVLQTGERLGFDHLVLALGARSRRLAIPGVDRQGVHSLRSAGDAERLRSALPCASRLVIIGAGFIGLEVAASTRAKGISVTVLEASDRLMGRVVSPAVSRFFLEAHRAMGTSIRFGAKVLGIEGRAAAENVQTTDETFPADLVLVAAGAEPDTAPAVEAGLAMSGGGILVDDVLLTSDPAISAIGDCAVFKTRHSDGLVRLESVQNAVDQAKCVAARLLGGGEPYGSAPWFWSDQGGYKLQIAGIAQGADHVHAAHDPDGSRLVTYCFRGERLIGIETVNRPGEHMAGRKLLSLDLAIARAEVEHGGFDLRAHVTKLTA